MDFTYRPIERWPTSLTVGRKRSQFNTSYSKTLELLDRELRYLKADHVVFQIALAEADIRRDGKPRADARPAHPGVILAFDSKFGPLSYPCDTFTTWEDNLRAIALALECLRTVDRYGVTRRGEQYQGWQCLTGPGAKMTREAAIELLKQFREKDGSLEDAYRNALGKLHPDRNGGDEAPFKRLQEAADVLGIR